ncbi:hypothetical protein F9883_17800 [Morganella morganii]|uniref:ribosome-inactivating family protein n=1 Tax=Morganella morganii TaxID=582 RepID=UPI0015F6CB58|nr:ribosome-inactivating family protein [Morganella morganii]MBA5809719.1 hypothetical protein [Morganella morganii]
MHKLLNQSLVLDNILCQYAMIYFNNTQQEYHHEKNNGYNYICFSFHAYAELNITPINDDFDYSNNLKYNESIRKLRSELSDHSSGYGKNVYISEKENKLYRIKIHSDEKKSTFISLVYNARNAYLLGFITNKKKEKNGKEEIEEKYYRFKEDTLIDVKDLTTYTLNFSGNYSDLEKNSPSRESIKINHNSLKNAIITLNNHHENNGNNTNCPLPLKWNNYN